MTFAALAAQVLAASGLAGGRPFLVLALLAGVLRLEMAEVEGLWLTSNAALISLAVLAAIEYGTRTDADFEELLRPLWRILSVCAGALVADVIATLGLESAGDASAAIGIASLSSDSASSYGLVGLGAAAALSAQMLRERALVMIQELSSPGRLLRWLETGGVVGVTLAVLLAPVFAVAIVVGVLVFGVVIGGTLRVVRQRLDARTRSACACGFSVRHEASRCPSCGERREPSELLTRG